MEINITNPSTKRKIKEGIADTDHEYIHIVSTDDLDKDKLFKIHFDQILSFEDDIEGPQIWWLEWSPLEGKNFTRSNHFNIYSFS